jgi:hypothetical protein
MGVVDKLKNLMGNPDVETISSEGIADIPPPLEEETSYSNRESERQDIKSKMRDEDRFAEIPPMEEEIPTEVPDMEIPTEPMATETPEVEIPTKPSVEPPKMEMPPAPQVDVSPPKAEIPKVELPSDQEVEEPAKKKKRLMTKEEAVKGFISGLLHGETGAISSEKEREYAILGGHRGTTKENLKSTIDTLESEKFNLNSRLENIEQDIENARQIRDDYEKQLKGIQSPTKEQLELQKFYRKNLEDAENKREKLAIQISHKDKEIADKNRELLAYQEAVLKGRKIASPRSVIGKKLQSLGEGAETVSSGVYGGKSFGRGDWFGPKGFLTQPYKQANITSSVVQPVRTRLSNLDAITRSTGAIVGHGMVDAVTTVRANRNIAPFGVPGTVAGARKQFEYNIPAKKILPGDVTTNINRDILPSIFSPVRPVQVAAPALSPMEYKQVVQPDGTIINVPVQQRKSKPFSISLKRFSHKANGPAKVTVKPVGSRLERGIASVGNLKPMAIDLGGRTNYELGLLSPKKLNINGNIKSESKEVEPKKESRKSKKNLPLVNLDSASVISKNLNKMLAKKKK